MGISKLSLLTTSCLLMSVAGNVLDPKNYAAADILVTDVAIIGGGSSGTYAAINLRKMGQNVVVVEEKRHLGGHTNTYTNHSAGITVDYGVQAFLNNTVTLNYFSHFGIPITNYPGPNLTFAVADFNTGKPVVFTPNRNLSAWAAQLAKYPWLDSTWNVSQPVAPDLLLPLGEFIRKYDLSNITFTLYFGAQGLSTPLEQSTVDVMKMVDPVYLFQMAGGSLVPTYNNNSAIYVKALAELGSNVLVHSRVTAAKRPQKGPVSLAVKTRNGQKLIQASKWNYMGYFTLLLNNTGLPSGYQWINANNSAATYNIPQQPGASQITSTRIPEIFYAWYRSPSDMKRKDVEKDTIRAIHNLQIAQNLTVTVPNIIKFKSHTPFKLGVSAQAISSGFYSDLYLLQGKRSTWYTGAAFIAHNSGLIWNFTQDLLPQIVSA